MGFALNFMLLHLQRSILEQQIKQKRQQAPHIRASDLQILRGDGNKEAYAYNGNELVHMFLKEKV